nr:hypothetical protein [uncultured Butyrivibrio sp.]
MKTVYGVSQYNHGHEYRWIFDRDTLKKELETSDIMGMSGEDISFPIGGSNSSSTWFAELNTLSSVQAFLTGEAEGPDLEDPTLVDIAEYLLTVDTDFGSCTKFFLDKLCLNQEKLTQYDDDEHHRECAKAMIDKLKKAGYTEFDYDDPFYGRDGNMRYSELCSLYRKVVA